MRKDHFFDKLESFTRKDDQSCYYENHAFESKENAFVSHYPFTVQSEEIKLNGENREINHRSDFCHVTHFKYLKPKNHQKRAKPTSSWGIWSHNIKANIHIADKLKLKEAADMVPNHIAKAREEIEVLMTPEIKLLHYGNNAHEAVNIMSVTHRKLKSANAMHSLTLNQWKQLVAYWDLRIFHIFRLIATILSLLAMIMLIVCITSNKWIYYYENGTIQTFGLWLRCNGTTCGMLLILFTTDPLVKEFLLQTVIGFLLFSLVFTCFGCTMCFYGFIDNLLTKKIYLFHSAAEILIISGFSSLVGINLYVTAIYKMHPIATYEFGYSYFVAWTADVCIFLSVLLFFIDEIIREMVRPRKLSRFLKFYR